MAGSPGQSGLVRPAASYDLDSVGCLGLALVAAAQDLRRYLVAAPTFAMGGQRANAALPAAVQRLRSPRVCGQAQAQVRDLYGGRPPLRSTKWILPEELARQAFPRRRRDQQRDHGGRLRACRRGRARSSALPRARAHPATTVVVEALLLKPVEVTSTSTAEPGRRKPATPATSSDLSAMARRPGGILRVSPLAEPGADSCCSSTRSPAARGIMDTRLLNDSGFADEPCTADPAGQSTSFSMLASIGWPAGTSRAAATRRTVAPVPRVCAMWRLNANVTSEENSRAATITVIKRRATMTPSRQTEA